MEKAVNDTGKKISDTGKKIKDTIDTKVTGKKYERDIVENQINQRADNLNAANEYNAARYGDYTSVGRADHKRKARAYEKKAENEGRKLKEARDNYYNKSLKGKAEKASENASKAASDFIAKHLKKKRKG